MNINFLSLSFPPEIEKTFINHYQRNSIDTLRFSLVAGIIVYALFGILDAELAPEFKMYLWYIRFAIVCPTFLIILILTFYPRYYKYLQPAVAIGMIVGGCGIAFMTIIIPPPVSYTYYAGIIIVFIWGYTFTRLRFTWATLSGWSVVAVYEVMAILVVNTPGNILLSNNFFFISANIAGMFACYSIEYYARKDFFSAYLLDRERDKMASSNRLLEQIVNERTYRLEETNKNLVKEIEERKNEENRRRSLESELIQAQKMEAIGTLAGGIAHDFNNLLMGIQGHASLLIMESSRDKALCEKLVSIEQLVTRGADLTKQLLGLARGGKYDVRPANLNYLIEKSSHMFGRTRKEITIHHYLENKVWTVDIDQGQIEQVFLNLFINAWQAMPGGGKLEIESRNVFLDDDETSPFSLPSGKYVRISVTDSGMGMDEKTKERIFEPFFTTKELGRGTGLGLASAYGIISSHHGMIKVSTELGKGTCFSIFLPASEKKPLSEEHEKQAILMGKETILLVDDEDIVVDVVPKMLNRLGYEVLTAKDGYEALELYKKNMSLIDLVILDMVMPKMRGTEVYSFLKQMNPEVRVLLSSGYSVTGEVTEMMMNQGCMSFIQKPFDINSLSQKIRELLSLRN